MINDKLDLIFGLPISPEDICLERTKSLLAAVKSNQEYTLLEVRRRTTDGESVCESLLLEIRVDAVPPRNTQGIQYPEPIALLIPESDASIVEVYALRDDFPEYLQHQTNYGPLSQICLTMDSVETILRQWTAQSFLRRISWWFGKTACNDIHPADQPLEMLFHRSNLELILPWNFDHIRNNQETKFLLASHGKRGVDQTFSLLSSDEFPPEQRDKKPSAEIFFLDVLVPPIVHKSPIIFKRSLGDLSEQFNSIGIDFLGGIRSALAGKITSKGVGADQGSLQTVVLLEIPLKREPHSEAPESSIRRSFFISSDWLTLGEKLGVFISHRAHNSTTFYTNALSSTPPSEEWRSIEATQMEVIRQLSPELCRAYSGITDTGPEAVLIGVGALGSKLLELWARSGWGKWTILDHDHVKPHNLSRHTGTRYDIGNYKVVAVADAIHNIFNHALPVTPHVVNVVAAPHSTYESYLAPAELVIDATTTIDYPRKASAIDSFPRHASVFLTPNGNSSVLMIESADRGITLRALESQYYRAMIASDWGIEHLGQPDGTFKSGASCRDVSLVMPYSKIIAHAATLSEQIQLYSKSPEAILRVWERIESGEIHLHHIPVREDRLACSGRLDVFIDAALEEKLSSMRTQALPNETGGILVGYFDFSQKIAVIVDALPAPLDSVSTPCSFQRGTHGVEERLSEINTMTLGNVHYVGEWHTHPKNHSALPSSLDIYQLGELAISMHVDGLPVLSLIVGEENINVLMASLQDD